MITNEERKAFWNRTVPEDGAEKAREILQKRELIADDDPEAGEKEIALAEEFLKAGGVDLDSATEIDIMLEGVQEDLADYWEKERRLNKQMEEILLRSGVTKLQIQWGNFRNARFSLRDRRRLQKIKRESNENFVRNLPHLTMLAALCKNKNRLEKGAEVLP